jgi:hypothetical protein
MFENVMLVFQLLREAISEGKLQQLFRQQIFRERVATPVVIELATLASQRDPLQGSGYHLVELNLKDLQAEKWAFSVRNRRFKALRNIKRGLRGFALARDLTVVGDIWCVAPSNRRIPVRHPDLDMLEVSCSEGDVYALDMFVDPAHRREKLAVPFHRSLELTLKRAGWKKIYSYYWDDNLPSKWMHWRLKVKELPKRRVSRFFFFIRTREYAQTGSDN